MDALIVIVIVLGALACWRVSVRIWPIARCRKCGGDGRNPGSNSDRWGVCRKCGGAGKHPRIGARTVR